MMALKFKSIKSDQHLKVRERDNDDAILRLAEKTLENTEYYHFRVPLDATVDIQYETFDKNNMLRIIFQLKQRKLSIQYFEWDDMKKHFTIAPLNDAVLSSYPFQSILQNINFTGEKHHSYVLNTQQPLQDTLENNL
ncbi:hypothetical protein [Metabacillus litoralis]|uniref:hypothetical protein n=1 Tax=Metabacillus litoralis TaxID=152268 RepID=UPI001CFD535F|nr:hypothetical protein [Metabacillus litoralis]